MLQAKRYTILASLEAAIGGITAVFIGALYYANPNSIANNQPAIIIGILGAASLIYYLSVHQFLRRKHQQLSAIILSVVSGLILVLVIATTGGIDSPYYSLWLLAIVVAGFFGRWTTAVVVVGTVGYSSYELWQHQLETSYFLAHAPQMAITLATGLLAEWVHINIGRNISQHEELSQLSGKLSTEQLKSEVLMNSVGDGVVVVNANRQIQLFNPSAVKITGWDASSANGLDYRLVLNLHRQDGNKIEDQDDPFLECWQQQKSLVRNNLVMETKGAHSIAVSVSVSPIFDDSHKITGGIGLFRDISADKEIARQRDEFISTASHEMRTPIAAIEGYLSLAMNAKVATIDTRAKDFLDKAHIATQHLGELFRDLLSVTKLEDSAKVDKSSVFDLTALVKEVVDDMHFTADKKGLEVQFGTGAGTVRGERAVVPVFAVKANPQRLREVIMNLMENAIKFSTEGRVNVTIGGSEDTVTVSVVDTGIGIAPEDIPHLFQKFYRIDSSATRTIGGTGLGLYLCRTIIERFDGRIWIESKLGEGSAFKFSLPRQKAEALGEAPMPAPIATATPPTSITPPIGAITPTPATPQPPDPNTTPAPPLVPKATIAPVQSAMPPTNTTTTLVPPLTPPGQK